MREPLSNKDFFITYFQITWKVHVVVILLVVFLLLFFAFYGKP